MTTDQIDIAEFQRVWACQESQVPTSFWCVAPHMLEQTVAFFDGQATYSADTEPNREKPEHDYPVINGAAHIRLLGPLAKYQSRFGGATSTAMKRLQVRSASEAGLTAIILIIDSHGGAVPGIKDLADEISRAKKKVPVIAFIEDNCTAAAYWIASQCTEVVANNTTALIGSLGTVMVVRDTSAALKKKGIKAYLIGSGGLKGAGTPGTEISADQLANWQRIIDYLNDEFKASVQSGRSFSDSQIESVFDGRIHPAGAALELGLIDSIKTFDDVVGALPDDPLRMDGLKGGVE